MKQNLKTCRRGVLLTVSAILIASLKTFGATNGFNQTATGFYDYNNTANWVGGAINGIWDTSLTLAGTQTNTFAATPATATGLTFNYAGNFAVTLQSSSTTAQSFSLGGDIGLNTSGGTAANVIIGNASNPLNVDLGGVNRTFTVAASRTLTMMNVISGSGFGITNAGAGTLILNGANTFSGGVTLNAGAINFANNSAFGTGAIIAKGGTIKSTAGVTTANNLVANSGTTTLDVGSGNWNFNGNITGSGAITRGTAATVSLYLGGDNSGYTGTFTVPSSGNAVVRFNSASAGSANASWVFNQGTSSRLTLALGTMSFGSMTGSGFVQQGTTGTTELQAGALGLTDTFSGVMQQASGSTILNFTKVGTGAMTLSGTNSYTGATTIRNGALIAGTNAPVSANGAFGSASSAIVLGDATTVSSATAMNPQLLTGGAFTMARAVTVGGTNAALGNASTTFTLGGKMANSSLFSGAIGMYQSLIVTQATGGTLTLSGGLNNATNGAMTVTFMNNGPVIVNTNAISNGTQGGTVALTQSGTGTTTLSAANTFTGGVSFNAGVVNVNATETPGTSGPLGASGTITFGGGTLQYTATDTADYSSRFATTASQPFKIDVNGQSVSFGTGLSSSGGSLTLSDTAGNGTLALNANYSLSSIAVNAGRLAVTSTQGGAGTVTVSSGAKLKVTASGVSQWSPASLTLNSGSTTLEFYGISSTTIAPLNPTSVANSGTATINVYSGTLAAGSIYPLVANVSATNGYSLAAAPLLVLGVTAHLVISGSALAMQVDSVADIWVGSVNGAWDINTTANWSGHATLYTDGDNVLFDDTATGTTTVTVGAQVNPGAITVNNSTKTYSITSSGGNYIGGSAALNKLGSGSLTLSGPNTYSGGTAIGNGTLQLGAANSLPTSGTVTFGGTGTAGTLDLAGNNQQVGGLAVGSGATAASQTVGNSSTANNASLTVNSSGSSSFGGVIKDTVGSGTKTVALTVAGGGTLTLSGANTFSGGTTIASGTLQLGATNGLLTSGTVTLGGSGTAGTLDLAGNNQQLGGLAVGSGATAASQIIGNSSTANNSTLTFNSTGSSTFGGIIQNAVGSGTKTVALSVGGGTLTLSGNNTYTGGTTINGGTLNVSGTIGPVGSSAITTIGGAAGNAILNVSGTMNQKNLFVGNLSGAVGAVYHTAGTVTVTNGGGDNLCVGNISGGYGYYNLSGGTVLCGGAAAGGENNTGTGFSGTGGNGILEVTGGFLNDIGWFVAARGTAAETGILNIFSGAMSYAGGGIVNCWGGGSQIGIVNVLGGTVTNSISTVGINLNQNGNSGNTGILNLNGGLVQANAISGTSGQVNFNGGTLRASANSSFLTGIGSARIYSGGATINDNGFAITVAQALLAPAGSGVSSVTITNGGAGYIAPPIITISRATGDTTGAGATAIAQIDNSTGNATSGQITNVIITCPGVNYTAAPVFALSGGGATTAAVIGGTIAANTSGGLTKSGTGSLTLAGTNTYTGATTISSGELIGQTGGSCSNSALTVALAATNGVKIAAVSGQWSCASLAYSGGGTNYSDFNFNSITPSTSIAPLNLVGDLTTNGTVQIIVRNGTFSANQSYPLLAWGGNGPASLITFAKPILPGGTIGTLTLGSKSINLNVGIYVPNLFFTNAPGVARIITTNDLVAAGLTSSQGSPNYTITVGTPVNGGATFTNSSGTLMKYTNSASFTGTNDSFTYTVSDGTSSATATVYITMASVTGPQLTPSGTDGSGNAVISFNAIPNYTYHMQHATTLGPPPDWTNLLNTITVPANGAVTWTNLESPAAGFYRLSYP